MIAIKLLILYLIGCIVWIFMFNRVVKNDKSTLHNRVAAIILWPLAIIIVVAGLFWFEIVAYFKD